MTGKRLARSLVLVTAGSGALLVGAPIQGSEDPAPLPDHAITHVHVVPMTREVVLRDRSVLIGNGQILAVQDASIPIPEGIPVIDGEGGYLVPGLADLHAHVRYDPETTFRLYLTHGVMTVRNMDAGDGWLDHPALRDAVEEGRIPGPRYLVSGPVLNRRVLPTVDTVEPMLAEHAARGYDFVKIHGDLDAGVYDALLRGAAARNLRVVGHAQRQRELEATLRLYSVSHAEEFYYLLGKEGLADPGRRRDLAERVARSGTWVCPTLLIYRTIADYVDDEAFHRLAAEERLAYLPAQERALWLSEKNEYRQRKMPPEKAAHFLEVSRQLGLLIKDFDDAGVPLILGTDAFGVVVPGTSVAQELELLVAAGLSPFRALQTATVNAARYLGEEGQFGGIEPGMRADLLLLGGNPLEDVGAVREIQGIFHRGMWVPGERIEEILKDIRTGYSCPPD